MNDEIGKPNLGDGADGFDTGEGAVVEDDGGDLAGRDVLRFDRYGPGAVFSEVALARMLNRHPASIKRAVQRGELPPPTRFLGSPCWTTAAIVDHLNRRLEQAQKDADTTARRVAKLRP